MTDGSDVRSEAWMLYPVRSEQIKAAESDDVDHAEWVIRVDGPLPGHPVKVVPEAEVERLRKENEDLRMALYEAIGYIEPSASGNAAANRLRRVLDITALPPRAEP